MTESTTASFYAIDNLLTDFYGFGGLVTDKVQALLEENIPEKEKLEKVTTLLRQSHGNSFGTKSLARKLIRTTK